MVVVGGLATFPDAWRGGRFLWAGRRASRTQFLFLFVPGGSGLIVADSGRHGRDRRGRHETALDLDLRGRQELARAVRATLRFLARQLDQAETASDLEEGAKIAHEYHAQLTAAGIAAPPVVAIDTLDDFLRATAAPGHPPHA
jgi:hypothetical protein